MVLVQGLMEILEALLNLADVYADLWPLDDTARVLMRVLLHYSGAAAVGGDKNKFMIEFCDSVLRENACRAVELDPPLSFREAKERWMELAERTPAANQQTSSSQGHFQQQKGAAVQQGRRDGMTDGRAPRGGLAAKSRVCKFTVAGQAVPVCFQYNRGGCRRTAKGAGCDDGRGGTYAHVCNFWDTTANKFCLATHPRDGNH